LSSKKRNSNCSWHSKSNPINIPHSGTESDSDAYSQNQLSPDASTSFFHPSVTSGAQPSQLSAIDESDVDEDEEEGEGVGWRSVNTPHAGEESVVKAGYLWKKGLRRGVRRLLLSDVDY
jgi:hypothetical protein